jgi:hypothetical protein
MDRDQLWPQELTFNADAPRGRLTGDAHGQRFSARRRPPPLSRNSEIGIGGPRRTVGPSEEGSRANGLPCTVFTASTALLRGLKLPMPLCPSGPTGGQSAQWRKRVSSYIMPLRTGSRAMAKAHPGRVGRRFAAIVATDLVGYSRLMGLDEVAPPAHSASTARSATPSWQDTVVAS